MKGEFLHKIDVYKLTEETNLSLEEVAKLSDIKEARNLGKWNQDKPDGSRPNYNAIVRLLEKGATVETLFGVDYKPKNSAPSIPENLSSDPEFQKGLQQSIEAKVSATVKTELEKILKQKGLL